MSITEQQLSSTPLKRLLLSTKAPAWFSWLKIVFGYFILLYKFMYILSVWSVLRINSAFTFCNSIVKKKGFTKPINATFSCVWWNIFFSFKRKMMTTMGNRQQRLHKPIHLHPYLIRFYDNVNFVSKECMLHWNCACGRKLFVDVKAWMVSRTDEQSNSF